MPKLTDCYHFSQILNTNEDEILIFRTNSVFIAFKNARAYSKCLQIRLHVIESNCKTSHFNKQRDNTSQEALRATGGIIT